MHESDPSQTERLDEELVAYLDGQLDRQSARQVEQRLASEEPVRRRLQELAQSWDLLDQLPHAVADDAFVRSTVEMVAVAAEQEFAEQQAAEPRRRRRRWLWGGCAALAVAIAGYVVAANVWTDPNEKLIRDLSVIENQERYKQAGDVDFLKKLNEEGLFSDETSDATTSREERGGNNEGRPAKDEPRANSDPAPTLTGLETPSQRRETLEKMTPQEKEDLRTRFDKFNALSPDEQQRLRRFEEQLNADASRDRLRRIMTQFHEWLKSLSPIERSELLALASAPRIDQIRSLQHAQEAKLGAQGGGPKLSKHDVDVLHDWEADFANNHRKELIADLPPQWSTPEWQKRFGSTFAPESPRMVLLNARNHWRNGMVGEGKKISVSDSELQQLMTKLSPDAAKILEPQTTPQRIKTIGGWIVIFSRARLFNRQPGEGPPQVSQDELNRFFEGLPANEKDKLLALPNDDDFNRALRWKYYQQHTRPNRGAGPRDAPGDRDRPRSGGKPEIPPTNPDSPPASMTPKRGEGPS
jgi:hypothetical protein